MISPPIRVQTCRRSDPSRVTIALSPDCLRRAMNHLDPETRAGSAQRSNAGFELRSPSADQYQALTADLTEEEREVILKHGTQAPFCGVFNGSKARGTRTVLACDTA